MTFLKKVAETYSYFMGVAICLLYEAINFSNVQAQMGPNEVSVME